MGIKTAKGMIVILAPRKAHRPNCFFAEGEAQIMISPAAIELSGVIVLPRVEDFEKISAPELKQVFEEVCWDSATSKAFISELSLK